MNKSKTVRATALVAMLIATPAFAQEAIREPGAVAFDHPGAEVLTQSVPFGYGPYDSYAYAGPGYAVHHGRAVSRGAATSTYVVRPGYDMYGYGCVPAPRVGAFATQPWDIQTPCEPVY